MASWTWPATLSATSTASGSANVDVAMCDAGRGGAERHEADGERAVGKRQQHHEVMTGQAGPEEERDRHERQRQRYQDAQ